MRIDKVRCRLTMGGGCEKHGDEHLIVEVHLLERKRRVYVCAECVKEQLEIDLKRSEEAFECAKSIARIQGGEYEIGVTA